MPDMTAQPAAAARRASLESLTWSNAAYPPAILSAPEAYAARTPFARYYRVAWWDDLPAGFTRFEWMGTVEEGGYGIVLRTDIKDFRTVLTFDELVLMFSDLEGQTHATE